ncbi:MAG: hypothetical protein K0Q74_681 [Gammaproteobacteria bacterium]|jgi:hypothetical protein|nr:hypothetical protein [Gammaproteobacteria bacterium]
MPIKRLVAALSGIAAVTQANSSIADQVSVPSLPDVNNNTNVWSSNSVLRALSRQSETAIEEPIYPEFVSSEVLEEDKSEIDNRRRVVFTAGNDTGTLYVAEPRYVDAGYIEAFFSKLGPKYGLTPTNHSVNLTDVQRRDSVYLYNSNTFAPPFFTCVVVTILSLSKDPTPLVLSLKSESTSFCTDTGYTLSAVGAAIGVAGMVSLVGYINHKRSSERQSLPNRQEPLVSLVENEGGDSLEATQTTTSLTSLTR